MPTYTVTSNGLGACAINGCQIGNHVYFPDATKEVDISEDEAAFLLGFVGEGKPLAGVSATGASQAPAPAEPPAPVTAPTEPAPPPALANDEG